MDIKKLLEKRRIIKKKKPDFIRQDAHIKPKLSFKWRKPKGSDSKMRVGKKGKRQSVKIGFGSPALVRGFDASGLIPVKVESVSALEKLDPKKHIIVIGSTVGIKKRMELLKKAIEKNVKVSNYKDSSKVLDDMKTTLEEKTKQKKQLKSKRDKKKVRTEKEAEKIKKEEEKKNKELAESDKNQKSSETNKKDAKSDAAKKEKDKLLITTQ